MKVLWVSNVVFPDLCEQFRIKKVNVEGWKVGMLEELSHYKDVEIALTFPVYDVNRRQDGIMWGSIPFYSFDGTMDTGEYSENAVREMERIFSIYEPDIIYVWGTEYNHARAALEAAKNRGMENKVIVEIQGLVSVIALHYANGIPVEFVDYICDGKSIRNDINEFEKRGKIEIETIRQSKYICGRTKWDEFCSSFINPDFQYFKCHCILRHQFYDAPKWDITKIRRHSIFVSQAQYPVKGFHHLLKALTLIQKEFPDIEVNVAGNNPFEYNPEYAYYLDELLKEVKVKVTFVGNVGAEVMINLFLASNVFVSASNIENSPNSISEAMLLGVPIVSSLVGGCDDLIENRFNGLLYQHDAYYMLAGYISEIFNDDDLAVRLSKNAIKTAETRHDRKKIGKAMYDYYMFVAEH